MIKLISTQNQVPIFGMANLRGKQVTREKLDFSFYFSCGDGVNHANRVKICFDPNKLSHREFDGYMELHGDYSWSPNDNGRHIKAKQVNKAREFFKKYRVLFNSVWFESIPEDVVQDYLRGLIDFEDVLVAFEVSVVGEELYDRIQLCKNLTELTQTVEE